MASWLQEISSGNESRARNEKISFGGRRTLVLANLFLYFIYLI